MTSVAAERLRVLLLVTSLDAGGAQRHVRDLMAYGRGVAEFHLAGGSPGWLAREAGALGVPVYPLPLANPVRPGRDLRAAGEILRLLARIRPHVLHVHSTKAAFLGRLAAGLRGVPAVYTVHGWAFQAGTLSPLRLAALAAERAVRSFSTRLIAVSRRDADIALRWGLGEAGRVHVIENGIDPSAYLWHAGPYGRRLLYLGRLEPGKGLATLLHALGRLRDLPWSLAFCGTGRQEEYLRRIAEGSGLKGRVRFLGWVEDPRPVLAESDCLVLPSDKEGLPYSVLEALASGLFLVVTNVGGLADLDLRHVIRIPPRDPVALRDALREYLTEGWTDPERCPRQDEVVSLLRQRFHVRRMVEDVIAVYRSALDARASELTSIAAPGASGEPITPAPRDPRG